MATGSKQPQTCVLSDLLWKLQNAAIAWRERIADDGCINSDQVVSCQNGDGNLIDVSIVCYLACSPAIHTNMIFTNKPAFAQIKTARLPKPDSLELKRLRSADTSATGSSVASEGN